MSSLLSRFANWITTYEKDEGIHYEWSGGYYCTEHSAGFEFQEAYRNQSCCPWCGHPVGDLIHD